MTNKHIHTLSQTHTQSLTLMQSALHSITYIILVKSFIFSHISYACFILSFFFQQLFALNICLFHISWQRRQTTTTTTTGDCAAQKEIAIKCKRQGWAQTSGRRGRGGAWTNSPHSARIHYCVIFLHYFIINQQNALNAAEKLQQQQRRRRSCSCNCHCHAAAAVVDSRNTLNVIKCTSSGKLATATSATTAASAQPFCLYNLFLLELMCILFCTWLHSWPVTW